MQQIARMMAAKGSKVCILTGLLSIYEGLPSLARHALDTKPYAKYSSILPVSSGQPPRSYEQSVVHSYGCNCKACRDQPCVLLTFWSSQDILTAIFLDQVKVPFMVLKEWWSWTGSSSSIEEPTFMMPGKRDERHIYRRSGEFPSVNQVSASAWSM